MIIKLRFNTTPDIYYKKIVSHQSVCLVSVSSKQQQFSKYSRGSLLQRAVSILSDQTSCAGGRHNMPPPPDLLTFKMVSNRVTCDMGYLCANFSLPIASLFST